MTRAGRRAKRTSRRTGGQLPAGVHGRDVPGVGYRPYRLAAVAADGAGSEAAPNGAGHAIENEWLRVEVDPQDGTLTLTDKATGRVMAGLNRVRTAGSRRRVTTARLGRRARDAAVVPPTITCRDEGPFGRRCASGALRVPADLTPDRAARHSGNGRAAGRDDAAPASARAAWTRTWAGQPGAEPPAAAAVPDRGEVRHGIVDGHFDRLVRRPPAPVDTTGWAEQPQPTAAQRAFTAVAADGAGFLLAARGLPEYERSPARRARPGADAAARRGMAIAGRPGLRPARGRARDARRAVPGPASADSLIPFGGAGFGGRRGAGRLRLHRAAAWRGCGEVEWDAARRAQAVTLEPATLVLTAISPRKAATGSSCGCATAIRARQRAAGVRLAGP